MFSFISELHAMLQKSGYNLHCDAEVILPFLLILYNLSSRFMHVVLQADATFLSPYIYPKYFYMLCTKNKCIYFPLCVSVGLGWTKSQSCHKVNCPRHLIVRV